MLAPEGLWGRLRISALILLTNGFLLHIFFDQEVHRVSAVLLGKFQHEVVPRIPTLAHKINLIVVHLPHDVVQVLHSFDAQFFFRPNRRQDLVRGGVEDVDRGRAVFHRIVEAAHDGIRSPVTLQKVDAARPRTGRQSVR